MCIIFERKYYSSMNKNSKFNESYEFHVCQYVQNTFYPQESLLNGCAL